MIQDQISNSPNNKCFL